MISDKAKVEKAVQEVERQILAPLRHEQFTSFTALNVAIAQGLQRLNSRVMHGYGLARQGLFEPVDQPVLKPLPALPFVFGHWKSAKVNGDYHIEWNTIIILCPIHWSLRQYRSKSVTLVWTNWFPVLFKDDMKKLLNRS